jgi:hypothetical protein
VRERVLVLIWLPGFAAFGRRGRVMISTDRCVALTNRH